VAVVARELQDVGRQLALIDVLKARTRIAPFLAPTQLAPAPELSELLGIDLRLKLEVQQPTHAFKVRGGVNLLAAIEAGGEPRPRGFVTASTGNHGQSIAYAARLFGHEAVIYAPEDCNPIKAESIRRLGARLVLTGPDFDTARDAAESMAREQGYRFIGPIEPPLVAGVATASFEILEAWPEVDAIVVPLGGGSGAAAACLAGKGLKPELEVFAVQATGAPAFYRTWQSGRPETTERVETFAEGLATRMTYPLALELLRGRLDDVVLVDDHALRRAMIGLLRHQRVLAEAPGAASLAAVSGPLRERLADRRVALIVSGGNVTPEQLAEVLRANSS
jgi:threonine dehydratase